MARKNTTPKKKRPFLRIRIEKFCTKKALKVLGIVILLGAAAVIGAGFGAYRAA